MEEPLSTKYTVVPIAQPYKLKIIQKYVADGSGLFKASLCRFYLRGLCLLKKEYCKYGHGIDDVLDYSDEQIEAAMQINVREGTQKNIRFTNDSFFNQKSIFAHEPTSYYVLWQFQQQHNLGKLELMEIDDSFQHRNRLRLLLHEHNWKLFMEWLCRRYPDANMIMEWIEHIYKLKGFVKQHTHCKFNGLLTWLMKSGRYFRYEVLLPPVMQCRTTIVIDLGWPRPLDMLMREKNPNFAKKLIWMCQGKFEERQKEVKGELVQSYLNNTLPNQKTTLCKFFMKGNCMFDEEECKYSHSIRQLNYRPDAHEAKIADEGWFVQKPIFIDKTLGYPSLMRYQTVLQKKLPNYKCVSYEELNKNAQVRQHIRGLLMRDLYRQFLQWLEKRLNYCHLTTTCVQVHYHNVGFGKCLSNRFQSFLQGLEHIDYCQGSYIQVPFNTRRKNYIFSVMADADLDAYFSRRLHEVVDWCISSREEQGLPVLTEQDIRKAFYEKQQQFVIPLHLYLKRRNWQVSHWLKTTLDIKRFGEQVQFDFSESVHRIKQEVTGVLKQFSAKVESLSKIEKQVLVRCECIPLHCLKSTGMRRFLLNQIIGHGRQVYMFSAAGEARVLNPSEEQVNVEECMCDLNHGPAPMPQMRECPAVVLQKYQSSRIVIVDGEDSLLYAHHALSTVNICGVDLQGTLKAEGWIYLVQIGIKTRQGNNQVLLFDIFRVNRQSKDLLEAIKLLLAWLFRNPKCIKVMQDCQQDSLAIHKLLGTCLVSVLDTCGFDIYLTQRSLYESLKKGVTHRHLSNTLQKVPGLNAILSKYGQPINELKEKMKQLFELPQQKKAPIFESRPFQPDFLEYSARDVQELVDVGQKMLELDTDGLALQIGRIYSCAILN